MFSACCFQLQTSCISNTRVYQHGSFPQQLKHKCYPPSCLKKHCPRCLIKAYERFLFYSFINSPKSLQAELCKRMLFAQLFKRCKILCPRIAQQLPLTKSTTSMLTDFPASAQKTVSHPWQDEIDGWRFLLQVIRIVQNAGLLSVSSPQSSQRGAASRRSRPPKRPGEHDHLPLLRRREREQSGA